MKKQINLPIPFQQLKNKNNMSIGSWITMSDPSIAEIMAKSGFDWLVIDMEHSALGLSETGELIRVVNLYGIPALVRVGENNSNLIKRVMDSGASGVIVPMVNTKESAIKAVEAVKYPPVGNRGVGLFRAQGYGTLFNEYMEWVESKSTVIVQIEHIEAVRNINAILSVEGVDGFIVGPYDLSASLGIPGQFQHPDMLDALDRINDVISQKTKHSGFHVVTPDVETALGKIKEGYTFLAFGVDFLFIGETCRKELKNLRDKLY